MDVKALIKKILASVSPKLQANIRYRYATGEWIDWKNPQDFNAKINILKLTEYYNNEEVTACVDKYLVHEWLQKQNMGNIATNIIAGPYDNPSQIEWDKLPNSFVVKCNHSCGTNIIVENKNNLEIKTAEKQLSKWMKTDLWKEGEVQYKFIKKKIFVEEYLGGGQELQDYRFFCFHGKARFLYVSSEENTYVDYFDMEYNKLPYDQEGHPHNPSEIIMPSNINEMREIAEKLAQHFPFVRVDLYNIKGRIVLSEMTFVPTGGNMKITPPGVLKEWGEWINLDEDKTAI